MLANDMSIMNWMTRFILPPLHNLWVPRQEEAIPMPPTRPEAKDALKCEKGWSFLDYCPIEKWTPKHPSPRALVFARRLHDMVQDRYETHDTCPKPFAI